MDYNTEQILSIYNETLYVTSDTADLPTVEGGFGKKILVLIHGEENNDANKETVSKIMGACKCTIDDYGIAAIDNPSQTIAIIVQHRPSFILSFDVGASNDVFKFMTSKYKLRQLFGVDIITSYNFAQMAVDATVKKELWAVLKTYFKL